MLGIIGAMDIEVQNIKDEIVNPSVTNIAGIDYVCGLIDDKMICVAQCNPGKINAAICAQAMIDNFDIDQIINVGVACSLSKDITIKNIVIAEDVCQHDIDITALGDELGYINGLGTVKIETDSEIANKLIEISNSLGNKTHKGTIASGDAFIASDETKDYIRNNFGAICGEMEGGAIGHVCAANDVPFAVLRSISDGGDGEASLDYNSFKKVAAEISTAIMLKYISTLD